MSRLIAAHSKDPAFSSFYNRISQIKTRWRRLLHVLIRFLELFTNYSPPSKLIKIMITVKRVVGI